MLVKKYWMAEEHRIKHLNTLKSHFVDQNKKEAGAGTLPMYKHLSMEELESREQGNDIDNKRRGSLKRQPQKK